jgi:2-polyprenyl-3-methyl-5-hydroxy-6-metoxy-1,4-benzoquinol methylase
MPKAAVPCPICNSQHLTHVNSYKHHCYVCNDCNNVFHIKKEGKYLLEWVLPRSVFKRLLPPKAFLRLFHDRGDISAADFYDVYADECRNISDVRRTEVDQLRDQLALADIDLAGKAVLDISGGPGYLAKELKGSVGRFVVTEFSEKATRAMSDVLGIETAKFDYTADRLEDIFPTEKFDLILLRSSIIFCPDLDRLVTSLRKILNEGGHVLVETIMPTLGEVFWWQQMEYKFPIIYSQETIEKFFYKHGFSFVTGYRDYSSYPEIRGRETKGTMQKAYTWLIDYPMVRGYGALARKSRVAIDQRLHKKMLTQIWQAGPATRPPQPYRNFVAGPENRSTHFAHEYNGYLRRDT